jgi:hypothetical protein
LVPAKWLFWLIRMRFLARMSGIVRSRSARFH